MKLTSEEKILMARRYFSEDIELFGNFFFKNHLKLETPKFHKEIYDLFESDIINIAIAAPRGHAKSTITDLVYLAWAIIHKKTTFALLISDTYSQATLFLDTLKAEFEGNDLLKQFYGNMISDSWAEDEIVVNGIMVKALGAGMKVRGLKYHENRPDLVIVDDLENDELVESRERRQKLERWVNAALIPSIAKGGRIIFIGTILHYDSVLAKLLSTDKYTEFTKKTYRAITSNEPLWKEHLNLQELDKIKSDYIIKGQGYLFYREYQNEPVSDEYRKFKLEKFKYYEDKELLAYSLNNYITIDRAYSLDKSADFTGIVIISVDIHNNWYVRISERFKGTEGELINKIFDLKGYFNPIKIGIEQKAFEYTIKPALEDEMRKRNLFFSIEELKDLGKGKNVRIEGLVPRFEAGTIFLKRGQADLMDELITFPAGIHDDLVDALAYNLSFALAPTMGSQSMQFIPQNLARNIRPNISDY
jgi:phage terminase large subunit-like protein